MTRTGLFVAAALSLSAVPATACFLELGIAGIATGDPLAIPVLIATRAAAEAGAVPVLDMADRERLNRAIMILGYVPGVLDGAKVDLPPVTFSVLQAQSGYWSRYTISDGVVSAEPHSSAPGKDETVLVVSDAALLAILQGSGTAVSLSQAGAFQSRGADAGQAHDAYLELLDHFAASGIGKTIARAARDIDHGRLVLLPTK